MKRLTSQRVARWLWERDGKPDGYGCGEAHRSLYSAQAAEVFEAIRTLGFRVTPTAAAFAQEVARETTKIKTEGTR